MSNTKLAQNYSLREKLSRCQLFVDKEPTLAPKYTLAKQIIRIFRRPAYYEMSQRCNLRCEGCFYYENADRLEVAQEPALNEWQTFFALEQQRKVSIAYFVGAEPSLEHKRLQAAVGRFPYGNIGTNGIIRLESEIDFRISIAVWGDDTTDALLRGSAVFRKALQNYAGDPRAIILLTLSPWNLYTVPKVLSACRDHGLPVTFNMFTPTQHYATKVKQNLPGDSRFFRLAPERGMPIFSNDDLQKAAEMMTLAMEDYSDITLFNPIFRDFITRPGSLYEISPATGHADDCGSRIIGTLRYYSTALINEQVKCCTPGFDCSGCRLYSGAWSSLLRPADRFLHSKKTFEQWLDMIEMLGRIFVYPFPETSQPPGYDKSQFAVDES